MANYSVRYIHKISASAKDVAGPVAIPDGAFSNRNTLAKALRDAGILAKGSRLASFRVSGSEVVAFPTSGIWHSVILTAE
jgi:hypothetical protein